LNIDYLLNFYKECPYNYSYSDIINIFNIDYNDYNNNLNNPYTSKCSDNRCILFQENSESPIPISYLCNYDSSIDFESILVKAYGEDILNDKAKKREVIHSMTDNQDLIRDEICNEEVLKDDLKNELKNQGYKKIYKVDDIEMQMGATVIAARNISIGRNIKGKAYMSKSY
jgi:hypothetical protein